MNILEPEDEEHTQEEDSSGSNDDEDSQDEEEEEEEEEEEDQVWINAMRLSKPVNKTSKQVNCSVYLKLMAATCSQG